jgi:hypothetical protein
MVRVATPKFLESELGVEPGPLLPYLAAYEIEVATLPQLNEHLGSAGLAHIPINDGIAVRLPPSIGSTIVFRGTVV